MRAERDERLFRAVARRTQPVRSEAHPGEEGHQRHRVKNRGIFDAAWRADEDAGQRAPFAVGNGICFVRQVSHGWAVAWTVFAGGFGLFQSLKRELAGSIWNRPTRGYIQPAFFILIRGSFVAVRRPTGTSSIVLGQPSSPVTTYSG